ncbi:PqqD family protein [soil metagenome]
MPRFVAPVQRVAHERVEDEVIAINLATGTYFSLRGSAADVWSLLIQDADVDGVSTAMSDAYGVDTTVVVADVKNFVDDLIEAGLLVRHSDAIAVPATLPVAKTGYLAPTLETYDDMEELLLLDPIHEVDEAGWPVIPVEPN